MQNGETFSAKLLPLNVVQFLAFFRLALFSSYLLLYVARFEDTFLSISWMLLCLCIASGLPVLLLTVPAGLLADRVPKRYVVLLSILADILLTAVALLFDFSRCTGFVFAGLYFVSRTFFVPAFSGLLPETFEEGELSRANGLNNIWAFPGMVCGLVAGWIIPLPHTMLQVVLAASVIAFIAALRIRFTMSGGMACSAWKEAYAGLVDLVRKPSVLLSALGENFFLAIGLLLPFLLLLCQYSITGTGSNMVASVILQIAPLTGFVAGMYLAGRLSASKIEPGLVPFGALGLAVAIFLGAHFFGPLLPFQVSIPSFETQRVIIPLGATVFLLAGGIGGGLFVLPLRTYLQQRLKRQTRGMSLAIHHSMFFLISALLVWLLFRSQAAVLGEVLPHDISFGDTDLIHPFDLLRTLALVTFLVTLFTLWLLPDFALRFLIISLGNTIYKLQITGAAYIPQHGPALLVANHVSFIDNILVSACTSRRIRFLMQEELLHRHFLLKILARLTGFIVVPSSGRGLLKTVKDVQDALRAGEIICIYPEGVPTRNSIIGRFRGGFLKMLPPELPELPVIPVYIGGMWGSRFSYYRTKVDHQLPLRSSNRAAVSFGAPLSGKDLTAFGVRQKICELSADVMSASIRPDEMPLHVQFAYQAKRVPRRILFRDGDGAAYSVWQAFSTAMLLSRELRQKIGEQEEYVGILLPNSSRTAISLLAVLYADRVPCDLNHTTPADVLEATIRQAGIRHVITSRAFLEKTGLENVLSGVLYLEDLMAVIPRWKRALLIPAFHLMPVREWMNLISPVTGNDVGRTATVLFSSGSTGKPKGIVLSHHNINSDMYAMIDLLGLVPGKDGILGNLPLFHSFGMTTCFWIPAATACPVTFISNPLDAAIAGKVVQRDKLTILYATPSFLQTYLRRCTPEQFESLRLVVTGAEKLRADIVERFREFIGGRLAITEAYGCTELSPVVTVNVPEDLVDLGRVAGQADSIGPNLEYVAAKVVDPLTYTELPPGSEGLLFVKGPMVMQGYLNAPELTEKAMFDGYYNTGDVVTMDRNGYVKICGRLSRFSKIAGEMIPHEMVERIINELCGTGNRVVAVGSIPDPRKGEALLVLHTPEMPFTPAEVVEQLREQSISNLWIPKAANFCQVESLPLLGSGKLDLSLLRKMADKIVEERNQNQNCNP